jgi:hypothetical protein
MKREPTELVPAVYSQVPVAFFFEGLPTNSNHSKTKRSQYYPPHISNFLATTDGLSLAKAFMAIKNRKIRQCLVKLIEDIADTA